ncbi:MAG: 4Fe-4S dicluster domain-containing protein [Chloroflexi bacterium]|nr:4Fe-4S dicluster domain-containing protein [Chloroflexota bacterium]
MTTRWGMVIDLQKCIGCEGCVDVCKEVNFSPDGAFWRQVHTYQAGAGFSAPSLSLPMNCMHCSDAPCLEVCPTTATFRRPDGIVDLNDDICVGCGYCVVACPYFARMISESDRLLNMALDNGSAKSSVGVATKCNFCLPRIEQGLAHGLEIGVAPAATPSCVAYCSGRALHFGNFGDPYSRVSRLVDENETFQLQEELGTSPSVYYLVGKAVEKLPGNGTLELVSSRPQTVWRRPAVVNFLFGSMAAGLFLSSLVVEMTGMTVRGFGWLAPLLACLGFASLALEAGHPWRSLHLFRHLGSSWMSREALAGAFFIGLGLLNWLVPRPLLAWGTAVAATLFLISQGFMVYRARAVAAWNTPRILVQFVFSGLAAGSSLALLILPEVSFLPLFVFAWAFLDMATWLFYLYAPNDEAFLKAIQPLQHPRSLLLTLGLGRLLPLILLGGTAVFTSSTLITTIAALLLILGSAAQKAAIIFQAGSLRGIQMKRRKSYKDTAGEIVLPYQQ